MSCRGVSPRAQQIARALAQPLLGDAELTSELLLIVRAYDEEAQIERSLEPEWLVEEALFDLCHEGMEKGALVSKFSLAGLRLT